MSLPLTHDERDLASLLLERGWPLVDTVHALQRARTRRLEILR